MNDTKELTLEKASAAQAAVLAKLQKDAYDAKAKRFGIYPGTQPAGYDDPEWQVRQMKEYDYFVVVHRDAVVGGCIVRNMREGCHILRFFIGVDFQGKGFGRAALARIEREYPEAAAITLDVPDWDEEARGFCESLGYGRAGTTFHPDLDYSLHLYRKKRGNAGRKPLFR
jgi:RimJ/RimL family protein N-acetyltransferase